MGSTTQTIQSFSPEIKAFVSDMTQMIPCCDLAETLIAEYNIHEVTAPSGQVWGILDLFVIRDEVIRRSQSGTSKDRIMYLRLIEGLSGTQIADAMGRNAKGSYSSVLIEANIAVGQLGRSWLDGELASKPDLEPDMVRPPRRVHMVKGTSPPNHPRRRTFGARVRTIDGVKVGEDEFLDEHVDSILGGSWRETDYPFFTSWRIAERHGREVHSGARDLSQRHGVFGRWYNLKSRYNSRDRVPVMPLSKHMELQIREDYSGRAFHESSTYSDIQRVWQWDHQYHGIGT